MMIKRYEIKWLEPSGEITERVFRDHFFTRFGALRTANLMNSDILDYSWSVSRAIVWDRKLDRQVKF
jgi:hypothetical protein